MKYIETTKGKSIAVDDVDYDWLVQHSWCVQSQRYAASRVNGRLVLMHRLIMQAIDGQYVDHINGDGLDNRRENLRICTHAQNMQNQMPVRLGTSKYKGVSWDKVAKKWAAHINLDGKPKKLGRFVAEEDAAKAYDSAAIEHYGEYARPNGEIHR